MLLERVREFLTPPRDRIASLSSSVLTSAPGFVPSTCARVWVRPILALKAAKLELSDLLTDALLRLVFLKNFTPTSHAFDLINSC